MKGREKLLSLLGYFKAENLLHEIVVGMSDQEAVEMYEHISRMNDINQDEDENEEE